MTPEPAFGFAKRNPKAVEQREQITQAVVQLHTAMRPILDVLDSKAAVSMSFNVAGDKVKVTVTPGEPNDEAKS